MATNKRDPPPLARYMLRVVLPFALVGVGLAAALYVGHLPTLRELYGEFGLILPAAMAMVLVILPIAFYFTFLIPQRRRRLTPWYKVFFYSSAMQAAERAVDGDRPGDSFLNRPLLPFRGRWIWVTVAIAWVGLPWMIVDRISRMREEGFDFIVYICIVLDVVLTVAVLVHFTRQIRERRRRQVKAEAAEPAAARRPSGEGIDWTAPLQSEKAQAAANKPDRSAS